MLQESSLTFAVVARTTATGRQDYTDTHHTKHMIIRNKVPECVFIYTCVLYTQYNNTECVLYTHSRTLLKISQGSVSLSKHHARVLCLWFWVIDSTQFALKQMYVYVPCSTASVAICTRDIHSSAVFYQSTTSAWSNFSK